MKELLINIQEQINMTRILIKGAQSREETEAHIQHLEALLLNQSNQQVQPTLQKPYLSTN